MPIIERWSDAPQGWRKKSTLTPMFINGEGSDQEDEFSVERKKGFSSSILGAKDAQRVATLLRLPRIAQEPPEWVQMLQRAAAEAAEAPGEPSRPDPNAAQSNGNVDGSNGCDSYDDAADIEVTPEQSRQRRRRNSITTAIKSVLRPALPPPLGGGEEAEPEPEVDIEMQLATELEVSGYGRTLNCPDAHDDLVLVGHDRVPRVLLKLGQALKACGGLDEPGIFMAPVSDEQLLEQAQRMRLGRSTSRVSRSWVDDTPTKTNADAGGEGTTPQLPSPSALAASEEQLQRTDNPHAIAGLMLRWLEMLPATEAIDDDAVKGGCGSDGVVGGVNRKGILLLETEQLRASYNAKDPLPVTRATLHYLRGTVRGETFRWLVGLLAEVNRRYERACVRAYRAGLVHVLLSVCA